jgi:FkbM family methyltransferase
MIENLVEVLNLHLPGWSPNMIADIGAHNGAQTLELAAKWPTATVLAMECSPAMWPECLVRVSGNSRIIMLPFAATSINGAVKFHMSTTNNTGYGSVYKPTESYPFEPMPTQEVTVPSIRLDTLIAGLKLPGIDMFWLDAQGGEMEILGGLGDLIEKTRVVYTEFMLQPMYHNQPLLGHITNFLQSKGFTPVWAKEECSAWFGDAVFIRK